MRAFSPLVAVLALMLVMMPAIEAVILPNLQSPLLHCKEDIKSLCQGNRSTCVWRCLIHSVDKISGNTCRRWVHGMGACYNDAQRLNCINRPAAQVMPVVGVMNGGLSWKLRECLRSVISSDLSIECTSSEFYQRRIVEPAAWKLHNLKELNLTSAK